MENPRKQHQIEERKEIGEMDIHTIYETLNLCQDDVFEFIKSLNKASTTTDNPLALVAKKCPKYYSPSSRKVKAETNGYSNSSSDNEASEDE